MDAGPSEGRSPRFSRWLAAGGWSACLFYFAPKEDYRKYFLWEPKGPLSNPLQRLHEEIRLEAGHARFELLSALPRFNRHAAPRDDWATVVFRVDQVDDDAAFGDAGGDDGFVD